MLILGLLGMYFDDAVVFVTFIQIGCGHTVVQCLYRPVSIPPTYNMTDIINALFCLTMNMYLLSVNTIEKENMDRMIIATKRRPVLYVA